MFNTLIWNISKNGAEFPIQLWKHPKISIQVNNVHLEDIFNLEFSEDNINLVYLTIDSNDWKELSIKIINTLNTHPKIQQTLIHVTDFQEVPGLENGKILVLESPLRKKELKLIIDKTIQAEYYKRTSLEIGSSCLSNIGFFEGVFDLAREENRQQSETIKAFEKMLEYESKIKVSRDQLLKAVENVNDLREKELVELHERIKAAENMDALKSEELKIAIEESKAKDAALQFSRIEEINMDKILKAHTRLFKYSDQEIRALMNENIELKKKLGIPVEEEKD
ncbi:MAG: hypothetical protein KDK36_13625 [Leptospiraceae bacterium]|nr:hypothetical protein [Leptospiraceae bacterium]